MRNANRLPTWMRIANSPESAVARTTAYVSNIQTRSPTENGVQEHPRSCRLDLGPQHLKSREAHLGLNILQCTDENVDLAAGIIECE
jgi:hypothetical protein